MTPGRIIAVLIAIVALCAVAVFVILRLSSGDEDRWVCENGEWTAHGRPRAPKPETGCGLLTTAPTPAPEPTKVTIYTDRLKFDLNEGTISGLGLDERESTSTWTIITSSSTKIYTKTGGPSDEIFSLSDLRQRIKTWEGPRWPVYFIGELVATSTLEATEIYYTIQ